MPSCAPQEFVAQLARPTGAPGAAVCTAGRTGVPCCAAQSTGWRPQRVVFDTDRRFAVLRQVDQYGHFGQYGHNDQPSYLTRNKPVGCVGPVGFVGLVWLAWFAWLVSLNEVASLTGLDGFASLGRVMTFWFAGLLVC